MKGGSPLNPLVLLKHNNRAFAAQMYCLTSPGGKPLSLENWKTVFRYSRLIVPDTAETRSIAESIWNSSISICGANTLCIVKP